MGATGELDSFSVQCDGCRRVIPVHELEDDRSLRVEPLDVKDNDDLDVVLVFCARCSCRTMVVDGGQA